MASAAVMTAIESAVAANWTHTPIVAPNGGGSVPDDGSAYLIIQYPVAVERMISIGSPGSNVWREEGGVRIVLNIQAGTGLGSWPARIDALRAALRGKTFADGAITTWEASPTASDDRNDDGAYYVMSFAVAYQADLIG